MSLLFALILAVTPTVLGDDLRVVPGELPHLKLEAGQVLKVTARYRAQLGSRIEVSQSPETFQLPPDHYFPELREAQGNQGLITMTVIVTASEDGFELLIQEVSSCSNRTKWFENRIQNSEHLAVERQKALFSWGFGEVKTIGEPALLDSISEHWVQLARSEISQGFSHALSWLRIAANVLDTDERWIEIVNEVARLYRANPSLNSDLEALSLIKAGDRWRARSELLKELNMVDRGGTPTTIDQVQLQEQIDHWNSLREQATLLRGKTSGQYKQHISVSEIVKGMTRDEVILARGYPERVTWKRVGDSLYEGWFYPGLDSYLIDGVVFTTGE